MERIQGNEWKSGDAYQHGETIEKSKEVITHKSQDGGYFHWGENSAQRFSGQIQFCIS